MPATWGSYVALELQSPAPQKKRETYLQKDTEKLSWNN